MTVKDKFYFRLFSVGILFAIFFSHNLWHSIGKLTQGNMNKFEIIAYGGLWLGYLIWLLWFIPSFFTISKSGKRVICITTRVGLVLFSLVELPIVTVIWPWYIWNIFVFISVGVWGVGRDQKT
jgi:hypothetical protein